MPSFHFRFPDRPLYTYAQDICAAFEAFYILISQRRTVSDADFQKLMHRGRLRAAT